MEAIKRENVRTIVAARKRTAHKGEFGRVLIIAGSEGMMGAAVLSARGALRSGAGLATVSCDAKYFPVIHFGIVEATCIGRAIAPEALSRYDSIAIGPGLGTGPQTESLVCMLLDKYEGIVILDADALNEISLRGIDTLSSRAALVMTPHEGEAARLLRATPETVRADRKGAAIAIAEKFSAICVLKGAGTLIASPDGRVLSNPTGNPGMATGGSGDVLTGVLAGFSAQFSKGGFPLADIIAAGVYIHGYAGDLAARSLGEYGLIAGDIAASLPYAIKENAGG